MPVRLASRDKVIKTEGFCQTTLIVTDRKYKEFKFNILESLCNPVILGRDFLSLHKSVKLNFDGSQKTLDICTLKNMNINPARLFENLPNVKPKAAPSRKYSPSDSTFIQSEIKRMYEDGIIEDSISP